MATRKRGSRASTRAGGRNTSGPPPRLRGTVIARSNLDGDEFSTSQREHAANLLKETALFRNISRRLLIDVVERSLAGRLKHAGAQLLDSFVNEEDPPKNIGGETTRGQILAIVVLRGTLIAANKPPRDFQRAPISSPLPPRKDWPEGFTFALELQPGVYSRGTGPFTDRDLGDLRLEPPRDGEVTLLVVSTRMVETPVAAWMMDLRAIQIADLVPILGFWRMPELIWIAATTGGMATVEALTHVLAGKIATDYPDEPAGLVILSKTPQLLKWTNNRFEDITPTRKSINVLLSNLQISALFKLFFGPDGRDVRGRLFFLHTSDTLKLPDGWVGCFNRVVYLTDEVPEELPKEIRDILREEVVDPPTEKPAKTHLSSFLPSILANVGTRKTGGKVRKFKAGRLRERNPKNKDFETSEPFMQYFQDSTIVPFDFELLEDTWKKWVAGGGTAQPFPFLAAAVGSGAISDSITGSWGRAVTNRRVGVACSGGGASAYRIGPVLKRMKKEGIPVDVFAGLSGGALVGSFYSHRGMAGFKFARCLGPFFQLTMPLVLLWTWPFEFVIDYLLDGARVEELGIRFAAVTAALPETKHPSAMVVVHGTLGEAVRASGSLPPSFAPTDKNGVRYTDGGAGTAVPAQVARDCGADVVLACNVIPGPARGNPFSGLPGGWLIRKTPMLGRLVDNYTWYAFFMAQTSREFGTSADVFVEFDEQDFPLLESVAFIAAKWIIKEAEKEHKYLDDKVQKLHERWKAL